MTISCFTCKPLGRVIFFILITAAGIGCTSVESQSFTVPDTANIESAQIAVDADFSRYDRLQAVDMGIYFPAGSATPEADLQRIRQIFRTAFLSRLDGYTIVREPAPTAMKVQASLIDLRNAQPGEVPDLRSGFGDVAQPGSLVFLMELRDSESDRVLARAADRAAAPTFAAAGTTTDWASVEQAASRWAILFRQFLDANLAR